MIDLSTINNIHFIGIGGVGNSAIAEILHHNGYSISGSDLKQSEITNNLEKKGIKIYYSHKKENVSNVDLIVYSAAVMKDNIERLTATENNIPQVSRAEMLGKLMEEYQTSIAISGTHGKTTTTSMLTTILNDLSLDPTSLIGGSLDSIKGNVLIGESNIFITEACEYMESFLELNPMYGIILNIEEDHLDYYEDLQAIIDAFIEFSKKINNEGALIINTDDYNTKRLPQYTEAKVITIGINQQANYQAKNITFNDKSHPSFDIFHNDELMTTCSLSVPGQHNIYNALAAFAMANFLSDDYEEISNLLKRFTGAKRRFDILGKYNDATIIDDYAHHPTEIKASLSAASKLKNKKIKCIFQPHTYSRTKSLLLEFAPAFELADEIIITDIYAAREKNTHDISAKDLVHEIKKEHKHVQYIPTLDAVEETIRESAKPEEIIIFMGAGNIREVGENLIK